MRTILTVNDLEAVALRVARDPGCGPGAPHVTSEDIAVRVLADQFHMERGEAQQYLPGVLNLIAKLPAYKKSLPMP